MTIINPHPDPDLISKEALEYRYWLNQVAIPSTPDNIYNIPCQDKMFKIKLTKDYPFGSVAGFTQEQDVIERFFYPNIDKDSLFIDAGACWGQYTLRALSIGAKVIAFEPDPRCIKGLNNNIDLNPGFSERFILYEGALGHENGIIKFEDLEDIPMINLDYFLDNYSPTFIKIDVEGMEWLVIEGAVKVLKKYKPKLLIENHIFTGTHSMPQEISDRYIERTRKMVTTLNGLGYKFEMGPGLGRVYFTFCH